MTRSINGRRWWGGKEKEEGRNRGRSQEIRKGGIRVSRYCYRWGSAEELKQDTEMICFRVSPTAQLEDAGGRKVNYGHYGLSLSERH